MTSGHFVLLPRRFLRPCRPEHSQGSVVGFIRRTEGNCRPLATLGMTRQNGAFGCVSAGRYHSSPLSTSTPAWLLSCQDRVQFEHISNLLQYPTIPTNCAACYSHMR